MEQQIVEEQVMPAPANDRLAAMMGGQMPAEAQAPTDPAMAEAPVAGDPAMATDPAAAAPAPQEDPTAPLMQELAATRKQLEELQAQALSDTDRRILEIANGGPDALEEYLSLKNTDFSSVSPLDAMKMQFMEQKKGDPRSYDEKMDIFHDRMRLRFGDYDPTDTENYGLSPGALDMIKEEADAWTKSKEQMRQEKLLSFEAKKQGPPPFTDEDHIAFSSKVADLYSNLKNVAVTDSQGNQIQVDVSEIPGFDDEMKGTYLKEGPGEWLSKNLLPSDDKGRLMPNAEKIQQLVVLEKALPYLLTKAAEQARKESEAEFGKQKVAEIDKIVDVNLGIKGPDSPASAKMTGNQSLQELLLKQRSS